mmetsp:Transcript_6942/g.11099  ORF Transcript_6942/g.11099 Transcript_6942/m.11099 type:complete len:154 (-) Transcript_6942:884-1345(-)
MFLAAENDGVHGPTGDQRKEAGQDQPGHEQTAHEGPVASDLSAPRCHHRDGQVHKRDDRQDVDRANWPHHPQIVDPKTGQGDNGHQGDPRPPQHPMRAGAFGPQQLPSRQDKSHQCTYRVPENDGAIVDQGLKAEIHFGALYIMTVSSQVAIR